MKSRLIGVLEILKNLFLIYVQFLQEIKTLENEIK